MDDDFYAKRRQWSTLIIEGTKCLIMGGKFWIDPELSQHVQGEDGMWYQLAPQIFWEAIVAAGKDSNKMIFEGLDDLFCWVQSVVMWISKLVLQFLCFN